LQLAWPPGAAQQVSAALAQLSALTALTVSCHQLAHWKELGMWGIAALTRLVRLELSHFSPCTTEYELANALLPLRTLRRLESATIQTDTIHRTLEFKVSAKLRDAVAVHAQLSFSFPDVTWQSGTLRVASWCWLVGPGSSDHRGLSRQTDAPSCCCWLWHAALHCSQSAGSCLVCGPTSGGGAWGTSMRNVIQKQL
jgi:hypothetical protein